MKTITKALLLAMVLSLVLAVAAGCQNQVPDTTDPIETTGPAACEHSYTAVVTAPTCTEAGYTTYTCAACGDSYTADEVPAAHTWTDVEAKAATCTEDGYTAHKDCSACDAVEGRTVIPAAHTWTDVEAKAATCTEDGYTAHKDCSACDAVEGKTVIPAAHTWDNADAAIKNCTVCGEHVNPDFAGGKGTAEAPYLIATAEQLMNISNYYETYKCYKVADGVATLDLTGVGKINLNGSFDGNGVKIVNLTTALFERVGYQNTVADIKISNLDVTLNVTDGRALVRNIFNAGKTTFENVAIHGYIEGLYNMGSFYNYGTANYDGIGADYTVEFINAVSDITIVCTSGNVAGGFLGHSYEGAGKSFTMIIDEKSAFNGKILTTNGKGNLYFATTSDYNNANNHFVINGEEVKFDNGHIPAAANVGKIAVVAPVVGENGYTVESVEGATKLEVYLNAQVTAHDADGFMIPNKNGLTWPLGHFDIAKLSEMGLIKSAVIVNGTDHEFGYTIEDGVLTIYSGRSASYESGKIYLQINQYDAEGELLATGTITVYTIEHNHTFVGLSCTTDGKCNCGATKKAAGHSFGDNAPVCGNCGAENPDYIAPVKVIAHQILGNKRVDANDINATWVNDQAQMTVAPGAVGSYDGDITTNWNPQTQIHWSNEPGIVYILNRAADLKKITITFATRQYYFDIYTSTDGKDYSFLGSIDANNVANAYTKTTVNGKDYYICTLDGLKLQDVTHIKLLLVNNNPQSDFVSINEIEVSEEGSEAIDTAWMVPAKAKINNFSILGGWVKTNYSDGNVGVRKSFDGSASTKWNPQAKGSYADNPGLIYRLNRPVDLKDIVVTVASHNHYFDVYTSSDCGATYQLLASVNAETAAQYYNGAFVCTIDGQGRENVTHVKFMFTGRANGSTFMNWCEVAINE